MISSVSCPGLHPAAAEKKKKSQRRRRGENSGTAKETGSPRGFDATWSGPFERSPFSRAAALRVDRRRRRLVDFDGPYGTRIRKSHLNPRDSPMDRHAGGTKRRSNSARRAGLGHDGQPCFDEAQQASKPIIHLTSRAGQPHRARQTELDSRDGAGLVAKIRVHAHVHGAAAHA